MKRYERYKDSGIKWIGEIPEHWQIKKIRSCFKERKEKVSDKEFKALSVSKIGVTPQLDSAVKTDNGDNRKKVCKGDFVVNSRSDRKGSCGVSIYDGSVSLINIVLTPRDVNGEFYHFLFRSNNYIEEFYRQGRGIVADLWTTRYSEMRNIYIPVPNEKEQKFICDYLNKTTTKIDDYIAKRENEIELIDNLKQSVIAKAVTKGLNPNTPMKDSSIPWIGMIPEHWELKRIGSFFIENKILNKQLECTDAFRFNYGTLIKKKREYKADEDGIVYANYTIIHPNDIIINGLNLNYDFISKRVAIAKEYGIITSAYLIIHPRKNANSQYFCYLLKNMDARKLFHGMGKGIRLTLSFNEIKKQYIPVPPLEEQNAIVVYLDSKIKQIETYKKSLLSEIDYIRQFQS